MSVFNHSPKLYISELRDGSQTLEALNDQFRHIAPRLDILSFYETLQTPVGPKKMVCVYPPNSMLNGFLIYSQMVVDKSSATLGYTDEISRSLNADHHTICKFDSIQDSNYISVRNALKTLVTTVRSTGMWIAAQIPDQPKIGMSGRFETHSCFFGHALGQ